MRMKLSMHSTTLPFKDIVSNLLEDTRRVKKFILATELIQMIFPSLNNYRLTSTGACHRTEAAAGIKYMSHKKWWKYVRGKSTAALNFKGRRESSAAGSTFISRKARMRSKFSKQFRRRLSLV
ncbi:hypothetical protein AJ80_03285 [Polytolypa hystricis UAMH7299]|uniref:Uncharacterized protein n=1 Tax=Polytolypa hystricis (strain UAMH7299) TaxID=1447883 RepID=A0A2B7YKK9_POLH7|nr:hypothetical protein AJ80_03285 [Polytolypa hystricis UAMH7299]